MFLDITVFRTSDKIKEVSVSHYSACVCGCVWGGGGDICMCKMGVGGGGIVSHSEHRFPTPSSKLCQIWLGH